MRMQENVFWASDMARQVDNCRLPPACRRRWHLMLLALCFKNDWFQSNPRMCGVRCSGWVVSSSAQLLRRALMLHMLSLSTVAVGALLREGFFMDGGVIISISCAKAMKVLCLK